MLRTTPNFFDVSPFVSEALLVVEQCVLTLFNECNKLKTDTTIKLSVISSNLNLTEIDKGDCEHFAHPPFSPFKKSVF